MSDNGLYQRYRVAKENGEPVDPRAIYFLLRLDAFGRDAVHAEASRTAAKAYAEAVAGTHLDQVGEDLLEVIAKAEGEE